MATLTADPLGQELEDFVAAHFTSRGCYVETGVKERTPDEILELDLIWTDYRKAAEVSHPVEVKSGDWGIGDVFKFFGWTSYLNLPPGQFVHKATCGRVKPETLKSMETRTGVQFVHIPKPDSADEQFKKLGLPDPPSAHLPPIWRFSFWLQRRLLKAITLSIKDGKYTSCARAAKDYHQLINDAVFFIPDVRGRVGELLSTHFTHQKLARSCAHEIETGKFELVDPPDSRAFTRALYNGEWYLVQACLYLAHRARLYIVKAVVDYALAIERGSTTLSGPTVFDDLIVISAGRLTKAMAGAVEELGATKSFRLFPLFWQVFLWSWGGFILMDRQEEEYKQLSLETGVPVEDIPVALGLFDRLFPTPGGWFREPNNDSRSVLMLMPTAMRGLGAHRRLRMLGLAEFSELGYKDATAGRMASDNNVGAKLLNCSEAELVK